MVMTTQDHAEAAANAAAAVPRLELPFLFMGLAAGWISGRALASPWGWSSSAVVLPATLGGALAGLLVGAVLRRELVLGGGFRGGAIVVVVAGALTGAAVGGVVPYSEGQGVWLGALCGLAFVPIALLVMAAAQRARRARLGSIVAAADRRAIWVTLGTTLVVASLVALPEWSARAQREYGGPWVTMAMAWLVTMAMGALAWLDWRAWRQVGALRQQAQGMSSVDRGVIREIDPSCEVDLGLGETARASLRGGSAYRDRLVASAVVVGDPDETQSAMRRALRRDALALAVGVVASVAHGLAMAPMPPPAAPRASEPVPPGVVAQGERRPAPSAWDRGHGLGARHAYEKRPTGRGRPCPAADPLCSDL